jgi:hypothetical protein
VTVDPCPWSGLEQTSIPWCEERVCAWIREPANTWSNAAYLIVGLWLVRKARRDGAPALAPIGVTAILVAFGSFFYHASATVIGEICDVMAMLLFSLIIATTNLARLLDWTPRKHVTVYALAALSSLVALVAWHHLGIPLFALQITLGLVVELRIARRSGRAPTYRPLFEMCGVFAVAWAIWWLDLLRVVCSPTTHWISGHAVWHVLNSLCFGFLYAFYRQAWATPSARGPRPA